MSFAEGPVTVAVPATSANLGPGYDCFGLALDLYDDLTGEVVAGGLALEIDGEGADTLPRDESHLVVRSMLAAFATAGVEVPGLRLRFVNRIPQARGMGSSSAAIVGGLALARALLADPSALTDPDLLRLATAIEGHPDNVAPALFGGFVISGHNDEDVWADQARFHRSLRAVVFVPPGGVSTEAARGLLPAQVPHADAAANTGRAALFVTAVADAPERLFRATEDFLHQSFRAPAMPASYELVRSLRADGHAAVISGAGPTVLVLTTGNADKLLERSPSGWAAAVRRIDGEGVRVVTR